MNLSIRGVASPELPLRVLNLLMQHGITPHHVVIELQGGEYHLRVDAPMTSERGELVVAKLRAMVLVRDVTIGTGVVASCAA